MTLGKWLKEAREKASITQLDAALCARVTPRTWQRWEAEAGDGDWTLNRWRMATGAVGVLPSRADATFARIVMEGTS